MAGSVNALGLCLGASTVSVVKVRLEHHHSPSEKSDAPLHRIIDHAVHPHDGDPRKTLLQLLARFDPVSVDKIAVTGRKFKTLLNLSSISEPEAVESAYGFVKPKGIKCPAIVSAGGETFMVYVLDPKGKIANVLTGNKCASGTGEFFLQQLRRMDVSLDEAAKWAVSTPPYRVSGRCSVFCKSDCTHALNKGIPKSRVTAGLCQMMANKILELLKKVERRHIMITGGTARNRMMIEHLKQEIPGLVVPDQASYFEALGAALWALENETAPFPGMEKLFSTDNSTFDALSPLKDFETMVEFKSVASGEIHAGDRCILGLDVGSTTTKAVLVRTSDHAMLASVYLRTNGDPVNASRRCYRAIIDRIKSHKEPEKISVIGIGVCGSGRQIAGLHALTEGVINEIVAHAAAAVYFDPEVDTLFEIGGQDAKYTYITNGVPSDYAMNEACSAGTGSFLEESALETLGVRMEDIAQVALKGRQPPNFNDQCAAFIASDIKNAIHEGIGHEDIIAGLVYSICMNYTNRVKGNRPVGEKVFMQGGVCYNQAVPMAMAALTGKPIIVPPEPGLMGAFGAALEIQRRIENNLLSEGVFDLEVLAARDVSYGKTFICKGGKELCDRRCEISRITVAGKTYPFGGACNRYYNLRHNVRYRTQDLDLVRIRQRLVFEKYGVSPGKSPGGADSRGRVGINRSFLVNSYYPLYSVFFSQLGFELVLPDAPNQAGIDRKNAAFCYPAELAHGFFHTLITMDNPPEFVFLPHFKSIPSMNGGLGSQVCPFVQGETYYLRTTFRDQINVLRGKGVTLLTPLLDLSRGIARTRDELTAVAAQMDIGNTAARKAFEAAIERQDACFSEMKSIGRQVLADLHVHPERSAVVVFGRPYNAFVDEAHMGVPHKIATRGIQVIPMDFLPHEAESAKRHMYWGMGQLILKAARYVEKDPQLFGTYITNFSCGPDSFIIGYFRAIMGRKPSLTLELDSHTADAGLETRIEAFMDIVAAYRQLSSTKKISTACVSFSPARTVINGGRMQVITSAGEAVPMTASRVRVLFPSMGRLGSEALAAAFRSVGFHAEASPPANEAILKLGRGSTSCKECLPLILTTGTLLHHARNRRRPDEILIYFMPTGSGPCRFGQYYIFMEDLVKRLRIPDVAMFSLTSENGYAGLDARFHRKSWWAVVVSDIFEDIRSMLLANAADHAAARVQFEELWRQVLNTLENGEFTHLKKTLNSAAEALGTIPLKRPGDEVPVIALTGEIFVRRDGLSRQYLTERLAERGFAVTCAPVAEWIHYANHLMDIGMTNQPVKGLRKLKANLKHVFMKKDEKRIKSILSRSGLVKSPPVHIPSILRAASDYISPNLGGEAILTVGSAIREVASHSCGVIAIGPFGCMPNRLSEAILSETMRKEDKLSHESGNGRLRTILADMEMLPFLAVESDGSPFPQLINAKLEAFCLRAERLHEKMRAAEK